MTKLTKNQKFALEKLDKNKLYSLKEASALVKEMTKTKFDASVDLDVRLGIDPRKSNQLFLLIFLSDIYPHSHMMNVKPVFFSQTHQLSV